MGGICMTIIEETVILISEPTASPPPLLHRLCCFEISKTVCGVPRKSVEVHLHDEVPSECVVCEDIWQTSRHCPADEESCPNPTRMKGS